MNAFRKIKTLPRRPVVGAIFLYQKLFSPDHSWWSKKVYPYGYCKFYPTCSSYGKQAVKKYGVIRGGAKTVWRIARCNPWSEGGVDRV